MKKEKNKFIERKYNARLTICMITKDKEKLVKFAKDNGARHAGPFWHKFMIDHVNKGLGK